MLHNNDTLVDPGFVTELVKAAVAAPTVGILGAKIFYYDFEIRKDVIWFAGGVVHWWCRSVLEHLYTEGAVETYTRNPVSVQWVTGSAMMIRTFTIDQISLLDSAYFFGNEDVDYCLKAGRRGLKVVHVPTAFIWHKVGASRKKNDPGMANLSPHHQLLRQNAPMTAYVYHLMLLPFILLQWGFIFLIRHRDRRTMKAFASYLRNLLS